MGHPNSSQRVTSGPPAFHLKERSKHNVVAATLPPFTPQPRAYSTRGHFPLIFLPNWWKHPEFQFAPGLEGSGVTLQTRRHRKPQWSNSSPKKRREQRSCTPSRRVSGELRISVPLGTKLSRMRRLFTIQRPFRCP